MYIYILYIYISVCSCISCYPPAAFHGHGWQGSQATSILLSIFFRPNRKIHTNHWWKLLNIPKSPGYRGVSYHLSRWRWPQQPPAEWDPRRGHSRGLHHGLARHRMREGVRKLDLVPSAIMAGSIISRGYRWRGLAEKWVRNPDIHPESTR